MSAYHRVTPGSHLTVHYSVTQPKSLKKSFVTEKVETPLTSAFEGHEYREQAGSKRRAELCIPYHSYLLLKICDLPIAISSVHGESLFRL